MTRTGKLRRSFFGGQQSFARFIQRGHGLDDEQVDAGIGQGTDLLSKGGASFIEAGFAQRLEPDAERADGAGNVGGARLLLLEVVDGLPGQLDACGVDLGDLRGEAVAGEAEPVGAEGVGFEDLGAGLEVFLVNREDEVGVREVQFVVAAIDEDTAGVEHRAHGAIGEHGAMWRRYRQTEPSCCQCYRMAFEKCIAIDAANGARQRARMRKHGALSRMSGLLCYTSRVKSYAEPVQDEAVSIGPDLRQSPFILS